MHGVESGKCFSLFPLHPSAQRLNGAGAVCVKEDLLPSCLCDEVAAVEWVRKVSWPSPSAEDTLPFQSMHAGGRHFGQAILSCFAAGACDSGCAHEKRDVFPFSAQAE